MHSIPRYAGMRKRLSKFLQAKSKLVSSTPGCQGVVNHLRQGLMRLAANYKEAPASFCLRLRFPPGLCWRTV